VKAVVELAADVVASESLEQSLSDYAR